MDGAVARLRLTRRQILAFRRCVGGLEGRVPLTAASLRQAAWAGLQDSMPRAALLSLHARLEGVEPSSWDHPSLAQLSGASLHTYVVPKGDFALFSLGGTRRTKRAVSGPTAVGRAGAAAAAGASG